MIEIIFFLKGNTIANDYRFYRDTDLHMMKD